MLTKRNVVIGDFVMDNEGSVGFIVGIDGEHLKIRGFISPNHTNTFVFAYTFGKKSFDEFIRKTDEIIRQVPKELFLKFVEKATNEQT